VLKLNAQDGGRRRFILVEMEDYAETITAERVRRVIGGYGPEGKRVAGTGGSFDYYEVGPALFREDGQLNPEVGLEAIRRYVAYAERLAPEDILPAENPRSPYLLGFAGETAYFFYYDPGRATTLDLDFLARLDFKPPASVVYADNCLLGDAFRLRHQIDFKKIPRDLTRY
jgi:adenine-specific DNA-methyltransferase